MQYPDSVPQWEESYKITEEMLKEAGIIAIRYDSKDQIIR
jgi:hypothetical protein